MFCSAAVASWPTFSSHTQIKEGFRISESKSIYNQRNQSKQIQIYSFQRRLQGKGEKHHSEWQSKLTNLFPALPLCLKHFQTYVSPLSSPPNLFPNSHPCDQFLQPASSIAGFSPASIQPWGQQGHSAGPSAKCSSCGRRWRLGAEPWP